MESSDSDDDYYESADETLDSGEPGSFTTPYLEDLHKDHQSQSEQIFTGSKWNDDENSNTVLDNDNSRDITTKVPIQFRKRPERKGQSPSNQGTLNILNRRDTKERHGDSKSNSVLKDVPINLNKSLYSIQHLSSSVKERVPSVSKSASLDHSEPKYDSEIIYQEDYSESSYESSGMYENPENDSNFNKNDCEQSVKCDNVTGFKKNENELQYERVSENKPTFLDTLTRLSNEISDLSNFGEKILNVNLDIKDSKECYANTAEEVIYNQSLHYKESRNLDKEEEKGKIGTPSIIKDNIQTPGTYVGQYSDLDIDGTKTTDNPSSVNNYFLANKTIVSNDIQEVNHNESISVELKDQYKLNNETKNSNNFFHEKRRGEDFDEEPDDDMYREYLRKVNKNNSGEAEVKTDIVEECSHERSFEKETVCKNVNDERKSECSKQIPAIVPKCFSNYEVKEEGWNDADLDIDIELEPDIKNCEPVSVEEVSNVAACISNTEEDTVTSSIIKKQENLNSETVEQNIFVDKNDINSSGSQAIDSINKFDHYTEQSEKEDGWEDFDINDDLLQVEDKTEIHREGDKQIWNDFCDSKEINTEDDRNSWDDWGDENEEEDSLCSKQEGEVFNKTQSKQLVDEKLLNKEPNQSSVGGKHDANTWGWSSWGVNSLLSTASAVTQGISNVLEVGIGAPDPEALAVQVKEEQKKIEAKGKVQKLSTKTVLVNELSEDISGHTTQYSPTFGINNLTNLVPGVSQISKLVEQTKVHEIGTKVLYGGLDTLENIGKKTMEVLQEGDPGLKKKRALLRNTNKPVLSQVLREAKEKAEREDKKLEERIFARKCHFESLFDDYQGLVHLEALEMLSKQCELKIEQTKNSLPTNQVDDFLGTLDEVKQLCEFDNEVEKDLYLDFTTAADTLVLPLQELSIQKIVDIHKDVEIWFKNEETKTLKSSIIHQKAISTLAELTAATTHQFHKVGELLLIKERRKTVEEADTLLQLTELLCAEINDLSSRFATMIIKNESVESSLDQSNVNSLSTNIYFEAENAMSYIKQAFTLLVPVLQLGTI